MTSSSDNKNFTTVLPDTTYLISSEWFWSIAGVYLFIGLLAFIGNSLVIYAAFGHKNKGPMRYLDNVVKSLAVADMLTGLIGTPLVIYRYYLGRCSISFLPFWIYLNN